MFVIIIQRVDDNRIKKRDKFYWAICVPAACTHEDLMESLAKALEPRAKENGIEIQVTIDEADCMLGEFDWKLSPAALVFL